MYPAHKNGCGYVLIGNPFSIAHSSSCEAFECTVPMYHTITLITLILYQCLWFAWSGYMH